MLPKSIGAPQHAMARALRPKLLSAEKRQAAIARQLRNYPRPFRTAVGAIAARHERLADLAISFPALLFALAIRRRHVDAEAVIARVIGGASLASLAADMRLPMWTRKLPPRVFWSPIPDLPDGELFRRQIGNYLPKLRTRRWTFLEVISVARAWCDDGFAIWCAREFVRQTKDFDVDMVLTLALWAWHSHRRDTAGHRFCEVIWQPSISYKAADAAAEDWMQSMQNYLAADGTAGMQMWLKPGDVDGYSFVPVDSAEAIMAEAAAMKNCMRGYGDEVLDNTCRFWSVRSGGERRAVLSVVRYHDAPVPRIGQLCGPKNKAVDLAVWIAAAKWLHGHDLEQIPV